MFADDVIKHPTDFTFEHFTSDQPTEDVFEFKMFEPSVSETDSKVEALNALVV